LLLIKYIIIPIILSFLCFNPHPLKEIYIFDLAPRISLITLGSKYWNILLIQVLNIKPEDGIKSAACELASLNARFSRGEDAFLIFILSIITHSIKALINSCYRKGICSLYELLTGPEAYMPIAPALALHISPLVLRKW